MIDNVMKILNYIQPILLIVIPTIWVSYQKIKNKVDEQTILFKNNENKKNLELYDIYKHEQSKDVIRRVQAICNLYKDKTKADQVMYIQLENGTVATSKLCNMFITCLAEDDRFSTITKKISKLQRVPFSTVVGWIPEDASKIVKFEEILHNDNVDNALFDDLGSSLSTGVFDKEGILIGMVILNYRDINYDDSKESEQIKQLNSFKSSIETIFLTYELNCQDRKKQLKLEEVI